MTKREALNGKPYTGNPHVRFDEGEVTSCTVAIETEGQNSPSIAQGLPKLQRVHCRRQPEGRASVCAATSRRGSLLYKRKARFSSRICRKRLSKVTSNSSNSFSRINEIIEAVLMLQDKFFCSLAFALLIAGDLIAGGTPVWPKATRDAKPWVYNWWMGSAVDEDGLEAQCAALAEKGFGGFHVIPIYGAKGYESKYRKYLSDEWMDTFADAVRIGAKHGLGVDLTTGSGWCFGGPQIDATNGCWKLEKRFAGKFPYIEPVSTGQLVKRAGPGAEGLMMDPYSVEAMDAFLRPFSVAFDKADAARPVRMYHDSFEYYNAGWTPRFFDLFKKKRGYDLK